MNCKGGSTHEENPTDSFNSRIYQAKSTDSRVVVIIATRTHIDSDEIVGAWSE